MAHSVFRLTFGVKRFVLLGVMLAFAGTLEARDLPDPKFGCHLVVPDSWTVTSPNSPGAYAIQAQDPGKTKAVLLYVKPVDGTTSIEDNSKFIKQLEWCAKISNAKIVSEEHHKVGDTMFFVLSMTQTYGKNAIEVDNWATVVGGRLYQVVLYDLNVDPATDPELNAALASFSFPTK
jgi:hypothetical protein